MRVLVRPRGLRASVSLLLLAIPLATIEAMIASRAAWTRPPVSLLATTAAIAAAIAVTLGVALLRGRRWPLAAGAALLALWSAQGAWDAFRLGLTGLGYFTLLTALILGGALAWIPAELARSYFDPRLRWYEGLPRPIPGLKCELVIGDRKEDLSVCRMDRQGAFVFADRNGSSEGGTLTPADLVRHGRPDLIFRFRERQLRCQGIATRILDRGFGAGVRFAGLTPDLRKELGDFVETLRGEGYVHD